MKKLLFTIALVAGLGIAANAQTATTTTQQNQTAKQEVHLSEIPHAVQLAFRDEMVQSPELLGVWEYQHEGQTMYKIKFTKEGQTWVLKYAADGALMERNEKKDK
jgi:hypothetical protein